MPYLACIQKEPSLTRLAGQPAASGVASAAQARPRPSRPAAPLVLSLGLGIALSGKLPVHVVLYAVAALLLGLLAAGLYRFRVGSVIAWAAVALAGLSLAQSDRYGFPPDHLVRSCPENGVLTRLRLQVVQPSTLHRAGRTMTATTATVVAVETATGDQPASGRMLLRISGDCPLRPGQTVRAIGQLTPIGTPMNPGVYDWQAHYAQEGIYHRFHVDNPRTVQVVLDTGEPLLWTCRRVVREALAKGFSSSQQLDRATLQTLLLGDPDDRLEQTWADFRSSGTAHHLSISGMHLAIFALLVMGLTRCLFLSPRTALGLTVACVSAYAAMTQLSPPVVRSLLLCIAVSASMLLGRNTDRVQCLLIGVLAMLIYHPMDLFNPGFQLSAGTVAGLMLFSHRVEGWLGSWEHLHDRMARRIQPPRGLLQRTWFWFRQKMLTAIAAGVVAYLITLPLVALHFHQINPWTVLCSMGLALLVTASLGAAILKTILTLLVPALAGSLATMAAWPSSAMRWAVGQMAQLPGAQLELPPVPGWLLAIYAVLALGPVLPVIRGYRLSRITPGLALGFGLMLPFWATLATPANSEDLRVTVLSVGNGSAVLVEFPGPGRRAAMVDAGAMFQPNLFQSTLRPVLRHRGVDQISHVLLTHEDLDHSSAVDDLVNAYSPVVHRNLCQGFTLEQGEARFQVLAPPASGLTGNNASAVLRLSFAGRSILFTGDIEDEGIRRLLSLEPELHSDVLIAPHHGSAVASTSRLLEAVQPSVILCSSGRSLSGRQLKFDALAPSKPLRTGERGAITITIKPSGELNVSTWR